uniref:not5 protein isoform X3 n=1 Tax=Ciona intestinalis TaxID=7719 RepID=UPI000EF547A8|nr:not5 protein isoform X3 [Ciona intestinalis]|eukprot:XP_026694121.1 not5 protein isoform X3 [Ciona intestinalis]
MATKQRIPISRSKIPGFQSASRLPRTKFSPRSSQEGSPNEPHGGAIRTKYNTFPKTNNTHCGVPDNIAFSAKNFDKNGNKDFDKKISGNTVSAILGSPGDSSVDFEDNCEVVSLCSAEPSPVKQDPSSHSEREEIINGHHSDFCFDREIENSVQFENLAPDLIAFKRFQEISRSSSPVTSIVSSEGESTARARLPLPSAAAKSRPNTARKPQSRLATRTKSNSPKFGKNNSPKFGSKNSEKKNEKRDKRIALPTKATAISPSNAMDYVRQLTGNRTTTLEVQLGRRRGNNPADDAKTSRFNSENKLMRKISAPTKSSRGDGKWSNDLDTAMNLNRRRSQPTIDENEEVVSAMKHRLERKKLYQESRNRSDNLVKSNDELSERYRRINRRFSADDFNKHTSAIQRGAKISSPASTNANKSPKIARPVIRPPRKRNNHPPGSNSIQFDSEDDSEALPDEKSPPEEREDQNDEEETKTQVGRRGSVPVTTMTAARGRMRRRASSHETGNPHKRAVSGTSIESGYNTMTPCDHEAGDNLGLDIKLRQERIRQSERYREILENPEIITFGQWRVKQEGNYAPEEMYGATERTRIRSSTDSDARSPTRGTKPLIEENGFGDCDVINGNVNNNGAVITKSHGVNNQDNSSGSDTDSSHDTYNADEEQSLSVFDDLPSLNSTAMMADYSVSLCSNASDLPAVDASEHEETPSPITPTPAPKAPNKTINKLLKGGLNGIVDSPFFSRPYQQSSPLRERVASDDMSKSSAASGVDLAERMEEMLVEHKIVRDALEQLYKSLDKEERQKEKLETENRKLWQQNVDMTKEVIRLTKLLGLTKSKESQTDPHLMKNTWYKTELRLFNYIHVAHTRSVEGEIKEAADHLKEVKALKENFNQKIDAAEQKLTQLLKKVDSEVKHGNSDPT